MGDAARGHVFDAPEYSLRGPGARIEMENERALWNELAQRRLVSSAPDPPCWLIASHASEVMTAASCFR
jgi:hypothetical protein